MPIFHSLCYSFYIDFYSGDLVTPPSMENKIHVIHIISFLVNVHIHHTADYKAVRRLLSGKAFYEKSDVMEFVNRGFCYTEVT